MSVARRSARVDRAALVAVFLWFLVGGIAHFAFTAAEMRIVPEWMPWPRAVVLGTGVLEVAGASALLLPALRRTACWGLLLLTVAVTPANVFMLQHAERFPGIPVVALVLRLPLQVVLLWAIWRAAGPLTSGDQRPRR